MAAWTRAGTRSLIAAVVLAGCHVASRATAPRATAPRATALPATAKVAARAVAPVSYRALGAEIVDHVASDFVDPVRGARWVAANRDYAADIVDGERFADETNRRLA